MCRVIWHKVGNDTATKVEDVVGLALSNSCVAIKNKPPSYLFASACLNVRRRVERGRMGRRREERRRKRRRGKKLRGGERKKGESERETKRMGVKKEGEGMVEE